MPVQYTSITAEHLAVRQAAGVFDISHMGEVLVSEPSAETFLNRTLTNDLRKLAPGHGQYTLMCNENGGVVDDLYVYRLTACEYLLVVNAARTEADVAWLKQRLQAFPQREGVGLRDISDQTGAIAVQGPVVVDFIGQCFPGPSTGGATESSVTGLNKNQIGRFSFGGAAIWVSRTGYTGEDGFEIIVPNALLEPIWNELLGLGGPCGLQPAGLGARDTLRTEACYPLYGHELDENTTPIEAGLGFFVALDKGDFVGRSRLADQKAKGVTRKLVAFKMSEKTAPPRPRYSIWSSAQDGQRLGEAVSGTQSPTLGVGIGLGYVPPAFAQPQTPLAIEIRNKRALAVVVPKPFYRKPN